VWLPDRERLVEVRLHDRGQDAETRWAEDCGPAPGAPGTRYVRLGSIPFLHAKPTYGDVIAAAPGEDGLLAWDRSGLPHERIREALIEDGGRWAMILDCEPDDPDADPALVVRVLRGLGEAADIAVEARSAPRRGQPGRLYLAVPSPLGVGNVLAFLEGRQLPLSFTLVHPRDPDEE
jgi:hypothetical protein